MTIIEYILAGLCTCSSSTYSSMMCASFRLPGPRIIVGIFASLTRKCISLDATNPEIPESSPVTSLTALLASTTILSSELVSDGSEIWSSST
ncbi:MAG: hypothetical protein QW578_05115 [Thermoplasmatales archaeon]